MIRAAPLPPPPKGAILENEEVLECGCKKFAARAMQQGSFVPRHAPLLPRAAKVGKNALAAHNESALAAPRSSMLRRIFILIAVTARSEQELTQQLICCRPMYREEATAL